MLSPSTSPQDYTIAPIEINSVRQKNQNLFAEKRDSGSFLFEKCGTVVGILTDAYERLEWAFFQLIWDVLHDIQIVTGAATVRFPYEM